VNKKQFAILFSMKCLAIPVFYFIYEHYYGGIDKYDAGIFLKDSKIMNSLAYENFIEFIKLIFGLQDDSEQSTIYQEYLSKTNNWDEGRHTRLLFNDNRTLIRIHALIQFISFNSYFVHALFSCFFSFVGITLLFKTLKDFLPGKEKWILYAFIFLPNLWLFSGALLKEPLVILTTGICFFSIHRAFNGGLLRPSAILYFALAIITSMLIKPQIVMGLMVLYFLYRMAVHRKSPYPSLYFISGLVLFILFINITLQSIKSSSFIETIHKKQAEFYDMMEGGIYLMDDEKFIRIPYGKENIIREHSDSLGVKIRIRKNVSYCYWEHSHQQDTLYCKANTDTLSLYREAYTIIPSNSSLHIGKLSISMDGLKQLGLSIYHSVLYPLGFSGLLQMVVSFENIVLTFCLVITLIGICMYRKKRVKLIFLLTVFLFYCMLFGFTSPNTGAIVRYRSVVAPFIIIAAFITLQKPHESDTISAKS